MRTAKTLSLGVFVLFVTAGLAGAQSLAEVAKKEKKRRADNSETVKAVITERELSTSFTGDGTGTAPVTSIDGNAEGSTAAADSTETTEPEVQDETQTREYWQGRVKAAKDKIAALEQQEQSDSWGDGQRMGVDPLGSNNLARTQEDTQKLQQARAELSAIQAEARRAGVPPGWVR